MFCILSQLRVIEVYVYVKYVLDCMFKIYIFFGIYNYRMRLKEKIKYKKLGFIF